ncbi:Hsp33 family molecular chaperone [Chelatococcus reniformis]|uniref:33 kDa chaperonin n=1 Tax=Chelatococcus reniformis TaxID=1494448 RepID=A0A916XRS6_9HYPH|nr:Hsp33 family molecular chaperone [Chelatococcus reniformis]GGC93478.1 33 kDa chaperonin [Chelatococcus reniformis]
MSGGDRPFIPEGSDTSPVPDAGHGHAGDDRVLPFAIEGLDVRGRVVRLGSAVDRILGRHKYPPSVSRVLGEATALTVLLGASLKLDGRFQLQTRSDGPIDMIVVDFDAPDRVRACARFDAGRLEQAAAEHALDTGALLGNGHLAMTIDQGSEASRYQGIVALEGQNLEDAAHHYFSQSEQIPTRIRLAVGEEVVPGEAGGHFRAGALMVQFMPKAQDRLRRPDLPPGDAPEGAADAPAPDGEDDGWTEARMLVDTTEDHELIDPTVSSEGLLFRLFHERGVRVFAAQEVHEACQCSRERIMSMLTRFSAQERSDMVGDDGRIGVTCEFCSRHYDLDPVEVEREVAASR